MKKRNYIPIPGNDELAEYYRIGIHYWKVGHTQLESGTTIRVLIPWNLKTLQLDFGKNLSLYRGPLPILDCFSVSEDPGKNNERVVGNVFRLYKSDLEDNTHLELLKPIPC